MCTQGFIRVNVVFVNDESMILTDRIKFCYLLETAVILMSYSACFVFGPSRSQVLLIIGPGGLRAPCVAWPLFSPKIVFFFC